MIILRNEEVLNVEKQIKELFQDQPFGRYLSNKALKQSDCVDFEWNNFLDYLKNGEALIAINSNSELLGLVGFNFSQWDTDVFEKRFAFLKYFMIKEGDALSEREIGDYLLSHFHKWVDKNNIQVVVSKLDTQYFSPVFLLQKNGYVFYETITYQSIDVLKLKNSIQADVEYRYASAADTEILKEIALKNTYDKSHFYLDVNFPASKVDQMYACWIENALSSNKRIVIVEEMNQIAGVFIYNLADLSSTLKKHFGIWESAFVDQRFRGKGVGYKLFKATLFSCINDGVDIVDSSLIEKNILSQRFHSKLGFSLVNTQYTFHKWFNNC